MSNKIINCLEIAENGYSFINKEVQKLKQNGVFPNFATVLVGNNSASQVYVSAKQKKADTLGITNPLHHLSEDISQKELLELIMFLNNDTSTHGILLQLPLPKHLDSAKILSFLHPKKDIDGLHPNNLGNLIINKKKGLLQEDFLDPYFCPCTPLGCLNIIYSIIKTFTHQNSLKGKSAVILGRSTLVGIPVGQLLLNNDCTVTYVHSKSQNIKEICKIADILVVAIGVPKFVDSSFIKKGAIIIDVGISKTAEGKLSGDCNLEDIINHCHDIHISPVPKGVGPLTIMSLMYNVVKAANLASIKT